MTHKNEKTCFTPPLPACGVLPPQGGQITTHGFTLIELLVVVLIIGILAAVAVPQYQFIINKIRYVNAARIVNTIVSAQEMYYLANGSYASTLEELDLSYAISYLPGSSQSFYVNGDTKLTFDVTRSWASMSYPKSPSEIWVNYLYYYPHSLNIRYCKARGPWKKVCEKLGGTYRTSYGDSIEYYMPIVN